MLNIRNWLKYYLKDFNRDIGNKNTIIRKSIRIYGVVNNCLIVGARKGAKEGEILSEGDYY